jgi:hypothetical protein
LQVFATAQGGLTGAGEILTTLIRVPCLFILSLWTILKIGHCYGYPLDELRNRYFALELLIAAISATPEAKKRWLDGL